MTDLLIHNNQFCVCSLKLDWIFSLVDIHDDEEGGGGVHDNVEVSVGIHNKWKMGISFWYDGDVLGGKDFLSRIKKLSQ